MASFDCALMSSVRIPTSRISSVTNAIACPSFSNWCGSSVLSFSNGVTMRKIASVSFTNRDLSNLASFDRTLSTLGANSFHSRKFFGKRTNVQRFTVQAFSTGTAENAEAEVSEESDSQLVDKLLSLVKDTDRGALHGPEEHGNVTGVVIQLEKMGMPEPLKSPLIFGDWNVAYSSNPVSPGGGYRSWLGRLVFRTREMIQSINEPDVVVNVVRFSVFGLIGGDVSLTGKLTPLDSKTIQVDFQPPHLQVGPFKFSYGGVSMVQISIIYLDKAIRLGRGSRGTIFVFTRR